MKKVWSAILVLCVMIPSPGAFCTPPGHAKPWITPYVGLWQYPNRSVWIRIDSSGHALQCRIAKGGHVIRSVGTLKSNQRIYWQQHWGVDIIHKRGGRIVLTGKYGTFTYEPARKKMSASCGG